MTFKVSLEDKAWFWENVHKLSATDACWLWLGPKNAAGYGTVPLRLGTGFAHRLAYQMAVGFDAGERLICHRCDRPGCVRPAHLFMGTYKDNHDDMVRKHRAGWQNTQSQEDYRAEVEQWCKDNP